jgi:pimeloyl-ACP methyl ester carboxylesterase
MPHCVISISGFAQPIVTGVLGVLLWLAHHGSLSRALCKINLKALVSSRIIYKMGLFVFASDWKAFYGYPHFEKQIDLMYSDAKNLDIDAIVLYLNRSSELDISNKLSAITAPTLALTGSKDTTIPPSQSYLMAEKIPNCELVLIEGAGHVPMMERPTQLNEAITRWLDKIL